VNFVYRAYGVSCASDTPIPGVWLDPLNRRPTDLRCWINSKEPDWVYDARALPSYLYGAGSLIDGASTSSCTLTSFGSDEFFELSYSDGARFLIDGVATRLSATGPPSLSVDDLATYLRGPIMGFALRRRDVTALHASAACVAGRAIVLCGATEAGKSTTVATLALQGVSVLSDDITALHEENQGFQVEPGYPWICLWPDAVLNLFGKPDALPQLTPTWNKRYMQLDSGFEATRRPLGAIYLLAPRTNEPSAPRLECINPREAVLELVQNTYMNWLLDKPQRAAELSVLSRLASSVPVRRLIPHADPARINQLCDLILRDSQTTIARQSLVGLADPR
jgi:hypothetical protein